MPDTSVPERERVRFTLELDRELHDQLDEKREAMGRETGFKVSRNDFFAHLGKRFLEGDTRRDQRGRPVGTSA